jgi:hypothetical protein
MMNYLQMTLRASRETHKTRGDRYFRRLPVNTEFEALMAKRDRLSALARRARILYKKAERKATSAAHALFGLNLRHTSDDLLNSASQHYDQMFEAKFRAEERWRMYNDRLRRVRQQINSYRPAARQSFNNTMRSTEAQNEHGL